MGDRKHDIERYLRGELSGEEMHALEKEALTDPFLAEALEGIEQAGSDNFLYDLHTIRRSVHDRLRSNPRKKNKIIRISAWTGAIAATLLLIAVSGFIVLSLIREQAARQHALNAEPEPMPVEFMEKDTLVIPPPAESPVQRKINTPRIVKETPAPDAALDRSATAFTGVDVQATEHLPSEERTLIIGKADDQRLPDQHTGNTESIAKSERPDAAEIKSDYGPIADQPHAERKKESKAEVAASQPTTARALSGNDAILLRGKVVDADGEALPGVNVIVKDSNIGTMTDANGQYELQVLPGYSNLVFAFIGFQSQQVAIDGRQEVNVALREDVTSLSEVVVIGYSSDGSSPENSTFRFAEPAGGRSDFKKYLEQAVRYPADAVKNKVEGRVTVRFTVEADGQLSNFEVIKGIGSGTEEALINAIKAGPAWQPSRQGDRPMADTVKVRYRFKLPD